MVYMKVHAYDKTVEDLFSPTNVNYIVPRFQREYSWEKEEVLELWDDILSNIKEKDSKYISDEYFIGSLVVIGDEESRVSSKIKEFLIVDGQQRLTTITIMLSALIQVFKDSQEVNAASGLYRFIEGRDINDQKVFKLINETPKPFFQKTIQNYEKGDSSAQTEEEKRLKRAYDLILKEIESFNDKDDFLDYCKAIRDQILNLKTIFITVDTEEDAYTIFETLNARGINLNAIDLVKNAIFKTLTYNHPDDDAKRIWKEMQAHLKSRGSNVTLSQFYRHFWLSKYEFSREKNLYKSFKNVLPLSTSDAEQNAATAKAFLLDLERESLYYVMVTNPLENDWKLQEEKDAYKSLIALNLFKGKQVNTLLIALLQQYKDKKINVHDFIEALNYLENFHFIFSSIASKRTALLETKYSKHARNIRQSTSHRMSKQAIDDMKNDFNVKLPDYTTFLGNFNQKWFTNNNDADKKMIQYIFKKMENAFQPTDELDIYKFSLEHIHPQSSPLYTDKVGKIGNILPLSSSINHQADTLKFKEKIQLFKQSQLKIVKNFVEEYGDLDEWTDTNIEERTEKIAHLAYYNIWKIIE